jgi:hypothetical protein
VTGDRFTGQIVPDDGGPGIGNGEGVAPASTIASTLAPERATITEARVGALCGDGVDVSGQYAREIMP